MRYFDYFYTLQKHLKNQWPNSRIRPSTPSRYGSEYPAVMTGSAFWHPFADMSAVAGHDFVLASGDGAHVYDTSGRRYLDATAHSLHELFGNRHP